MDITICLAAIIAFSILMYIALDGFDLGIGILFPFFPGNDDRNRMMSSVAPVWDGNETWMVLGSAALYAVFPMVYSVVLPAIYVPLLVMVLCLILRGVAFEIRSKARRTRRLWDLAFIGGSTGATLCQGIVLGTWLFGIPIADGQFAGHAFDWFNPLSLFTGLALLVTYALLGCCWMIAKTDGDLQRRLYRIVLPLTALQVLTIVAVTLWTPLLAHMFATRWSDSSALTWLVPVPLLVVVCTWAMHDAVHARHNIAPFLLALGFVLLGYVGLLVSIWPYAILPGVTIWQAAAPRSSQTFTLVGALIIVPVILGYTILNYRLFRGTTNHEELHYH
ncbi:cytochrome d ubiquinol oxidase subunit II [Paraburkholderia hospita]|uniref:Cytochrome d ubiquinol oxidase subunit II n=1 Tax=Paraburkholderia hospita TaxID=169430 RepID=A0ABP2PTC5_9BURK|nr:cytochrome d ubiquinol oxidase subunit II [Paraburkholderia hospita]EIN00486.1 cytochrome d ubiquinol oxidase subunit II [Paraburkholderia hospita]OUL88215.1 cytochrome d ubiquinol oxidase subunit II [Paraburkholderia hospita]